MPDAAQTWTLAAPPGELRLSCSTLDHQGAEVVVDVVDPHGYWSNLTADPDALCRPSPWVTEPDA
jgi:hypothetical protein